MPVYNLENYICDSIESVLNQEYSNWELLIIDDGSTDSTSQTVKQYPDKRISYIYQVNQGVSMARNQGLLRAQGKYVVFLDGDDCLSPLFLLYMLQQMIKYKAEMAFCQYIEKEGDVVVKRCKAVAENYQSFYKFYGEFGPDEVSHMAFMYSVDLLMRNSIRFTSGMPLGEDSEFVIQAALAAKVVRYVDKPMYIIRRRKGSASRGRFRVEAVLGDIEGLSRSIQRVLRYKDESSGIIVLVSGLQQRILSRVNLIKREVFNLIKRGDFKGAQNLLDIYGRPIESCYSGLKGVIDKVKIYIVNSQKYWLWKLVYILNIPFHFFKK